jgi:hypothetical protein
VDVVTPRLLCSADSSLPDSMITISSNSNNSASTIIVEEVLEDTRPILDTTHHQKVSVFQPLSKK